MSRKNTVTDIARAIKIHDEVFGTPADPATWAEQKVVTFTRGNSFIAMIPDPCGNPTVWRLWRAGTVAKSRQRGQFTGLMRDAMLADRAITIVTLRADTRHHPEICAWAKKRAMRTHEFNGQLAVAIERARLM